MESNDGSRELFENIDNANFIEVAKMGYVEPARKVGIDACKNDYIFILDADEYPSKKIIEELVNFQSAKGKVVLMVPLLAECSFHDSIVCLKKRLFGVNSRLIMIVN
jgi:glycosyltransferase involved in cell wall biosynthesis